ncbi:MAG: fluoride efflux transporter CrcB [Thermoleophilaceae bacterium]|nr:fluoride efflux transporter CrcB [Thermoleophilaceae bacterium]
MIVALAIGLLGGIGSVARFAVHRGITREDPSAFPLGTFIVNMLGAFGIGILYGANADRELTLLIGLGFLGGFTTFSTWMFESERLNIDGYPVAAVRNIAFSTAIGFLGVVAGVALGQAA